MQATLWELQRSAGSRTLPRRRPLATLGYRVSCPTTGRVAAESDIRTASGQHNARSIRTIHTHSYVQLYRHHPLPRIQHSKDSSAVLRLAREEVRVRRALLPMIVPCTMVPFFSSIWTVSLVSFIRNLQWEILRGSYFGRPHQGGCSLVYAYPARLVANQQTVATESENDILKCLP